MERPSANEGTAGRIALVGSLLNLMTYFWNLLTRLVVTERRLVPSYESEHWLLGMGCIVKYKKTEGEGSVSAPHWLHPLCTQL